MKGVKKHHGTPRADYALFVQSWMVAHRNGLTRVELAKRIGVGKHTVYRYESYLRKHGVRLPFLKKGGRSLDAEHLNDIIGGAK